MEESLRIRRFEELPSAEEFETQIEPKNVPAVFSGCIKNWKAFSDWNPCNGGLDYLQKQIGSSIVEAMLSRSAPVFYGDIRSHERVPLPFSTFLEYCRENFQNRGDDRGVCIKSEGHVAAESDSEQADLLIGNAQQIYLAQVPIMNTEDEERVQLKTLREDIQTPVFLKTKALSSINLWMNNARTRSSSHYDPHHNLLSVVAGCKQVVLWPPSASPFLYPLPLHGEASNHSAVALENPDILLHPRAERSMEYSQKVALHAGDAIFIPEGWFHQVDSDDLTIAVNFWWRSSIMSGMSEHMDAYYLRRILRRLIDKEMNQVLQNTTSAAGQFMSHGNELPCNGNRDSSKLSFDQSCRSNASKGNTLKQGMLNESEPRSLQALHELVSLVHDSVKIVDQSQVKDSTSANDSAVKADIVHLEDDPIASIIGSLQPLTLQNVFLAMAQNFPRTLEALVLHSLSPVGAEVLTRKFDEMDKITAEEDRNQFYQVFYGVFDNHSAAMDAILNRKESFAQQAFKNVLNQYLGVKI